MPARVSVGGISALKYFEIIGKTIAYTTLPFAKLCSDAHNAASGNAEKRRPVKRATRSCPVAHARSEPAIASQPYQLARKKRKAESGESHRGEKQYGPPSIGGRRLPSSDRFDL
ncbi:hypothetical protein ACU4GD_40920 [Cupriavidus basilensis]